MKTKITMVVACVLAIVLVSCDVQYKKTKSGFAYRIIKGNSRDSLIKTNDVVKFHVIWKFKDSILFDSHGKMPQYAVASDRLKDSYSYLEILPQMRKGDSAVIIQVVDTLFNKGYQQQFSFAKKGDRINVYMRILEVFRNDSTARADADVEYEKDKPRMEKEMQEAMAKQKTKEEAEMQAYFASKKITPQKAPEGTYVLIHEKGTGVPAAKGKFVAVKYDGRLMKDDQQFDAGVYVFQLGLGNAIQGWHDGIQLFNKGGKGVLYVPGTLAYGADPRGPGGPFSALKFDVEILEVSDTQEKADAVKKLADSLATKNPAPR
ncbi:MAG TPA: FKBP-type peptidyl-prolyl cis-trans isomerase [Chitinophagaceae bacterium]|nr:FKBP-type peptidyl-prolyl cis-trans isomerase [Chitinophagaceae bacterium]